MPNEISILFAGDYHTYGPFDRFIVNSPAHQVFSEEVTSVVRTCDLAVFNMEDPVCDDKKSLCLRTGLHGVGSHQSIPAVKRAGFSLATLATNHAYDACDKGVQDTLRYCAENGIKTVGSGLTVESAREPFTTEISGNKITILNFARQEFNTANEWHGGANPLDVINNVEDIRAAKEQSEYVFVVVHEGADLYELPYPSLKKQMRFYAQMGADAVILHHARLFSGYEVHMGVPIFYGLGNLLHMCKRKAEHTGIMVRFVIDEVGLKWNIVPIQFDPEMVSVNLPSQIQKNEVLAEIEKRSGIIANDQLLENEWNKQVDCVRRRYLVLLSGSPYIFFRIGRMLGLAKVVEKYLIWRHRSFLNANKLFTCQAHSEAILTILRQLKRKASK